MKILQKNENSSKKIQIFEILKKFKKGVFYLFINSENRNIEKKV